MTFYGDQFPILWHWFCWLLLILCVGLGAWHFSVRKVLAENLRLHLIVGSAVVMALTWKMSAQLHEQNFGLHLFLITAVVMLIGVSPTLISTALALTMHTLIGTQVTWAAFATNYVLGLLPPILVSAIALKIVSDLPQKNLFTYMLGVGFAGAIAARLLSALLVYGLLRLSEDPALMGMAEIYLPWMLLISFPEGFTNGMIASSVAVFCPHWVRSFDEDRYLGK